MGDSEIWAFRIKHCIRMTVQTVLLILCIVLSYGLYKLWVIDTSQSGDFVTTTIYYVCPVTAVFTYILQCGACFTFDFIHIRSTNMVAYRQDEKKLLTVNKAWYITIFIVREIMICMTNFLSDGAFTTYRVKFTFFFIIQIILTVVFPLVSYLLANYLNARIIEKKLQRRRKRKRPPQKTMTDTRM